MQRSFKDCYVEFVDDLRYVYIVDSGRGPSVENMMAFLSRSPELEQRRHTKTPFEMCCLCLSLWSIDVPHVGLGSACLNVVTPNSSYKFRPMQF